jgi:hypothetical protein
VTTRHTDLEVLQNLLKEAFWRLLQYCGDGGLRDAVCAENVLRQLDQALAHFGIKGVHGIMDEHPAHTPARHEIPLGEPAAREHRRLWGWGGGECKIETGSL